MAKHPINHQTMPLSVFLIIAVVAGFSSCGILGSDDNERNLLKVTPVSAVEAYLEVSAFPGADISVERDGEEIYSFRMSRADTLLTDSGLQPATTYRWTAETKNGFNRTETRRAATLDTTSGHFTWETFTFGDHSSSVLRGISIIDENNIWAVGEIFMNDSTGQANSDTYNAAHWDGNKWKLKRITVDFRGNDITPPLEGIKAFSTSDIWMAGSLPIHGNGENWKIFDVRTTVDESLSLWKIWGNETSQIYAGGRSGSLAHYNGQGWQKIETATDLDVYDIHGSDEQGVVAIAAKRSESPDKAILRIKDDFSIESMTTTPIPFSISGIWFAPSGVTYVVGSRISIKLNIGSLVPWQVLDKDIIDHPYLFSIDANGLNDMVVAGGYGEILHFNGATWTSYSQNIIGNLYDIAIYKDTIVAVGLDGRQAFVTIGRKE